MSQVELNAKLAQGYQLVRIEGKLHLISPNNYCRGTRHYCNR